MPDYSTIEELTAAVYRNVSGPAGPRDMAAEREIFHPTARLTRTVPTADGRAQAKAMSLEEYIEDTAEFFAKNDFWEHEIGRRVDRFGSIAHVLSVY
jgi:hypothetical protein